MLAPVVNADRKNEEYDDIKNSGGDDGEEEPGIWIKEMIEEDCARVQDRVKKESCLEYEHLCSRQQIDSHLHCYFACTVVDPEDALKEHADSQDPNH